MTLHPPLEIRLLGPLEVLRRGEQVALPPSRKARALLGYLAATGRAHSREHLCGLLWDGPADPRGALRGALTKLRLLLDDDDLTRLSTEADRVQLLTAETRLDLASARKAGAPGDSPLRMLESASALFRGEFLEGLELSSCYRFDTWCTAERETARRLRLTILAALVERLEREPERALRYARERLLLDPCDESAHMDVMQLLAAVGRQGEALEQYERCRRILKSELGAVPSADLDALRRRMAPARPAAPMARPSSLPDDERATPPLAGRTAEREKIAELVKAAAAGGSERPLLLLGEAGIGKTRLLDEVARLVIRNRGEVLRGRAFEAEMILPYGAWIDALRDIPADEIPVELRSELAPLLPELAPKSPEPADRNRLFESVARLLATRAESRRPVALLLDDIQWIDEPSAALLHYLARGSSQPGVLFACASRVSELDDNPAATRLLRALRRDGLSQLEVAPLSAGDTASLLTGVGMAADAERVFARSEGNPLFALELARAESVSASLPNTIEEIIEERLARLNAPARALLSWAAALGRDFSLRKLARMAELPDSELLVALEELERRGVLQPRGARYDFIHDLVREIAYRRISQPRQRLIHSRIAHVLREMDDDGSELASEVAHHAILGGDNELAARACVAAARRALWAFAPDEAAELAARGVRQLEGIPIEARLSLHLELLALFVYPGMKQHRMPELERRISEIISEASGAGLQAQVHRGFKLIADIHYLDGDFGGALQTSLRAQEAGRNADPQTVVRAIGDTARCLGIIERDSVRAAKLAREAHALATGIGYEGHELPQALGYAHHHAGELDPAIEAFERAACLARNEHARWFECRCLARLVMIELEREKPEQALARCAEYLEVARKLDEGSDAPFAEALESVARLHLGESGAVGDLDRALERLRQVDSQWMIAYVQNLAAELEIGSSLLETANQRVQEALRSAQLVKRTNELAVARALLSRIRRQSDDPQGAAAQLELLESELPPGQELSARARAAIDAASNALEPGPGQ